MKDYLERLTSKKKPKKIIVCIIYMPNFMNTSGWAVGFLNNLKKMYPDATIDTLRNNLRGLLKKIHDECIEKIKINGTEIIPLKLYDVIDGTDEKDYENAVEPSIQGGKKMAEAFKNLID